ncbi:MAG: CBS domain-containing protein, partial [Calditrichia bacterium]|nr:CBS domain-containing protein [Calditrichia bacterium]
SLLPSLINMKIPIIGITGNPKSFLAKFSNITLDISVKKEACPNDLAPTASTTVTLALGDALAIALLKKRNFTRDDFAVLHPGGSLGKRLLYKVNDLFETGEKIGKVNYKVLMKKAVVEMANKRGICVILDNNETLVGVITTGDLNRLVQTTEHFFDIPVVDIMNKTPKKIISGTLAYTAFKKMEEFSIIALPVVDEKQHVVGIIHLHDLMKAGII